MKASPSNKIAIKVLGYTYTIQNDKTQGEVGAMGRCHSDQQTIQIANNINGEAAASTLLHEIIEALNFHLKLEMNEQLVTALEAGLFTVLLDNGVDLLHLLRYVRPAEDGEVPF